MLRGGVINTLLRELSNTASNLAASGSALDPELAGDGRQPMHTQPNMPVDVVDNRNHVIGQMRRDQVLSHRANFRTVHIILKAHGNLVLLQRLKADHGRSPGKLGSSVAGYLMAGESYDAAARRKLHEELKVTTEISLLGRLAMRDQNSKKFVRVYTGSLSALPDFDRDHIAGIMYIDEMELAAQFAQNPEQFTETFKNVYNTFGPAFR